MMLVQYSVNSDWLFNTQSRVLQADWFILEMNEKATLNINMPNYLYIDTAVDRIVVTSYWFVHVEFPGTPVVNRPC